MFSNLLEVKHTSQAVHLWDPILASLEHLNTSGLPTFLYQHFVSVLSLFATEHEDNLHIWNLSIASLKVSWRTLLKDTFISFCQCNQNLLKTCLWRSNSVQV